VIKKVPKQVGGNDRAIREERLAAALRENLRRRKVQSAGRHTKAAIDKPATDDPGIDPDDTPT
jgi:hypothetical protein